MKSRDIKHKLLIVQGFLQRLDIDYEETSSPMMDTTIFRYLICLTVLEGLDLHLIDVVTTYLYGFLNNDIYMKLPKRSQMPEQLIQNILAYT